MDAAALLREIEEERLAARAKPKIGRPQSRGERLLSKLKHTDAFSVAGATFRFSDDVWDFSDIDKKPHSKAGKVLIFSKVGCFVDYAKLYCFDTLAKADDAISTIRGALYEIANFLNAAEEAGYGEIASIPYRFYAERYAGPCGTSYTTQVRRAAMVRGFLEFYEAHFSPLHDRRCMKLLLERDSGRIEAEKEASKRDAIDEAYLSELLYTCSQVARDDAASLNSRIVACCLLMYSQIGHRTGEMGTFKSGAISSIQGRERGEDLWFADFKYSKNRSGGRWDLTPSTCYLNPIALEAFRLLEELCETGREAAGSDALVVFEGGSPFTTSSFHHRYHLFVADHLCKPPFLNCANRNRGMKAKRAIDAFKGGWRDLKNEASIALALKERGLKEDDTFVYPEIRMFRNTVCTGLYEQKVSLKWIKRHLNHLYIDMEAYYNRADRKIDEQFSNEVYRAILTKGERAVGPHGDAFMEKIYAFIDQEGYLSRLEKDPESVIEKLSRKYPLKKKRFGMCIRCAGIVPCAADGLTDEIMCAFGVCPNHCSLYWMAAGTYAEIKDTDAVVRANLERGRTREAEHELAKLRRVLDGRFALELSEIVGAVELHGADSVLEEHPELRPIVENMDAVMEEVEEWRSWAI